jgi:hypothetical protein
MRQLNIELNNAKLAQKKVQLSQYETRVISLKVELDDVISRRDKKAQEVSLLETAIQAAQNSQTVSS